MAVAADWMSAASFIGLAGTLYYSGSKAFAFVTGGPAATSSSRCCLPLSSQVRSLHHPGLFGARYEGNFARTVAVGATILTSFVYVVAQIYGVGLITSRFVGSSSRSVSLSAWRESWCARSWVACER